MLADPGREFLVDRADGDERFEGIVVNPRELQLSLIQRTIGVVFALPASENSAAFVQRASGQDVAAQRFARAARIFFAIPQIASQQLHFFEVWFHRFVSSGGPGEFGFR